jgi:hypothetical protein
MDALSTSFCSSIGFGTGAGARDLRRAAHGQGCQNGAKMRKAREERWEQAAVYKFKPIFLYRQVPALHPNLPLHSLACALPTTPHTDRPHLAAKITPDHRKPSTLPSHLPTTANNATHLSSPLAVSIPRTPDASIVISPNQQQKICIIIGTFWANFYHSARKKNNHFTTSLTTQQTLFPRLFFGQVQVSVTLHLSARPTSCRQPEHCARAPIRFWQSIFLLSLLGLREQPQACDRIDLLPFISSHRLNHQSCSYHGTYKCLSRQPSLIHPETPPVLHTCYVPYSR